MKLFWLTFLSLLVTMPLFAFYNHREKLPQDPKYDLEPSLDKVVNEHIHHIQQKYHWAVERQGGGIPEGKISNVTLGFRLRGPCSIDEARQLIIPAAQDLLERINKSEEINSRLANTPFDTKNINYSLSFVDSNNHPLTNPNYPNSYESLTYVLICNEHITYMLYKDTKSGLKVIHRESFEEAKRLLEINSDKE